jgi:hypothetical protein
VAMKHLLSADDIRKIFHGETPGTWEQVAALIRALEGEPEFFRPHWEWEEARQKAPAPPSESRETPTYRLGQLLSTFGDAVQQDTRALPASSSLASRRRALRRRLSRAPQEWG